MDLLTFTEEILNAKLYFLCSVGKIKDQNSLHIRDFFHAVKNNIDTEKFDKSCFYPGMEIGYLWVSMHKNDPVS